MCADQRAGHKGLVCEHKSRCPAVCTRTSHFYKILEMENNIYTLYMFLYLCPIRQKGEGVDTQTPLLMLYKH